MCRSPAIPTWSARSSAAGPCSGRSTPISRIVRELALRGAEAFEGDQAAAQGAAEFALSAADGTSGLDLESLKSARERAWAR